MGNVSELPGDFDSIFSLVRAEKVGGMVDIGGSELSGQRSDLILLMVEMLQ